MPRGIGQQVHDRHVAGWAIHACETVGEGFYRRTMQTHPQIDEGSLLLGARFRMLAIVLVLVPHRWRQSWTNDSYGNMILMSLLNGLRPC